MTPPLPFANDAEAEAEYRATRHLFTRPRVRFHPGTERINAGRISPPEPSVVVGRGSGGAASPSAAAECGTPTLRTVPGVAAPGAA